MSETPRTDEIARCNHVIPTDFACELEKELNQALARIQQLEREGKKLKSKSEKAERILENVRQREFRLLEKLAVSEEEKNHFKKIANEYADSLAKVNRSKL